eukprot:1368478-Amphidinium_carterae.1
MWRVLLVLVMVGILTRVISSPSNGRGPRLEPFPSALCRTLAKRLASAARARGFSIIPFVGDFTVDPELQPTLDRQPRRALPPIISEFAETLPVVFTPGIEAKVGSTVWLPPHSSYRKILDTEIGGDGGSICQVGRFRSPLEFVTLAFVVEHPFNSTALMHDFTKSAIDKVIELGSAVVVEKRAEVLARFKRMAMM